MLNTLTDGEMYQVEHWVSRMSRYLFPKDYYSG